ncbi:efflux RND transporter periplasmic adaptor subunit [Stieleria mannarensis]|uniref:efflux RND transporter periplasmic adaptor subunit n=1 Tax=Stieleria mannarensis TaxID=2755585 RepID=UPI001600D681|nr:efflux RND transporter periplasmic adaptor subunit [Rhodopirellula sp. JC639]
MSDTISTASTWGRRTLIALVLLGAVGAVTTLATNSLERDEESSILTHRVSRGKLQVTVTENGTVESSNNEEIKCMVKGGSTVLWVIETGSMVQPGDELVRLDTSLIEDNILAQEIIYENALANKITAESDVAVAEKSITEYLEGTFVEERGTIEKEIFDAEQALKQAELSYESNLRMAAKGLIKPLQLQGEKFAVESARKALELKQTKLMALEKYKKQKELQTLQSDLRAAKARLASFDASLRLEQARLEREKEQLKNCTITAEIGGMVIFPSMADWKSTPDIEEGAVVREQQTLLVIPDVSQMQVKVGIHESKVDRLKVGMPAKIELQDVRLVGEVSEIAEVTKPAGWWTGNLVKYDTIIKLQQHEGLKPGMSAIVDVVLADHQDVLTVPVASIVEIDGQFFCWVEERGRVTRRLVRLGDTNDEFTIVTAGLSEGEKVVLDPLAYVDEAQRQAMGPAKTATQDAEQGGAAAEKDAKTEDVETSGEKLVKPDAGT